MPNGKGFYDMQQPMSKTQPAKLSDREREDQADANKNGQQKNYETGAFGTNTSGSDYHDFGRKDSGLHGNFAQKDAHIESLKKRGQEGQFVRHWSGTHGTGEFQTRGHGPTAYNTSPIPETYQPATSKGIPPPSAIYPDTHEKPITYNETKTVDNDSDHFKKREK